MIKIMVNQKRTFFENNIIWSISRVPHNPNRSKTVSAPYLYNRICYGLGTVLIWTEYEESSKNSQKLFFLLCRKE